MVPRNSLSFFVFTFFQITLFAESGTHQIEKGRFEGPVAYEKLSVQGPKRSRDEVLRALQSMSGIWRRSYGPKGEDPLSIRKAELFRLSPTTNKKLSPGMFEEKFGAGLAFTALEPDTRQEMENKGYDGTLVTKQKESIVIHMKALGYTLSDCSGKVRTDSNFMASAFDQWYYKNKENCWVETDENGNANKVIYVSHTEEGKKVGPGRLFHGKVRESHTHMTSVELNKGKLYITEAHYDDLNKKARKETWVYTRE